MSVSNSPARFAAGLLTMVLVGCAQQPLAPQSAAESRLDFANYSEQFVEELLVNNPGWAIYAGDFRHADRLQIPDPQSRAADAAFVARHLALLEQFQPDQLPPLQRADHELIRLFLEAQEWRRTQLRSWQWDPSEYNVANSFAVILDTDYAPLEQRLQTVMHRMQQVPAYYEAAIDNISHPSAEHIALAIQQNRGALSVFDDSLKARVDGSGLPPAEKAAFKQQLDSVRAAIEAYIARLEVMQENLSPEQLRSFRLGADLYEPLFHHQIQSGYTAKQLYQRALVEKDRLHAQMREQAVTLWPQLFPGEPMPKDRVELIGRVIGKLSDRHGSVEHFVDEVRDQIRRLEAFITEHQLVDLDPDKPLIVRETPAYQRGVAIASIDAPGPFNPDAPTYYNVSPLDGFSPQQAESFLREYNHWVLQVLNIHEAIPGHYAQLVHANRSPSKVKSLLGNGAMIEGWAVYSERMMLEQGWGDQAPEMWLLYGKWNLRVVCNTILDYGVHVLGMSEDQALDLLMREAFQTETEARGKWRRVQLTHVQLTSYFAGFAEIYDLREQLKQQQGDAFDLRRFHNRFLSYGSAPVRVIKELMRDETH